MRRLMMSLLLLLLSLFLVGSRYYPTVSQIEVIGARYYQAQDIAVLANVHRGDPFFWVTRWRLAALMQNPWIARAQVVRQWPDKITITVTERDPLAWYQGDVYAVDGTRLMAIEREEAPSLTVIEGWGESRLRESLELAARLRDIGPEVVSYSPYGFDIRFQAGELYTPSLEALDAHWAGVVDQQGRIAIYPWGVSIRP